MNFYFSFFWEGGESSSSSLLWPSSSSSSSDDETGIIVSMFPSSGLFSKFIIGLAVRGRSVDGCVDDRCVSSSLKLKVNRLSRLSSILTSSTFSSLLLVYDTGSVPNFLLSVEVFGEYRKFTRILSSTRRISVNPNL